MIRCHGMAWLDHVAWRRRKASPVKEKATSQNKITAQTNKTLHYNGSNTRVVHFFSVNNLWWFQSVWSRDGEGYSLSLQEAAWWRLCYSQLRAAKGVGHGQFQQAEKEITWRLSHERLSWTWHFACVPTSAQKSTTCPHHCKGGRKM